MTEEIKENVQTPQAESAQQNTDLNINDLLALRNIVDIASQRGAFKAAEMESVGKVYNKLNMFLESVPKKEA